MSAPARASLVCHSPCATRNGASPSSPPPPRRSAPYDTVVSRAFAPLPQMLNAVAPLCVPETRVLAMKGKWPERELAELPSGWRVVSSRELHIPGLDAARCLIVLQRH